MEAATQLLAQAVVAGAATVQAVEAVAMEAAEATLQVEAKVCTLSRVLARVFSLLSPCPTCTQHPLHIIRRLAVQQLWWPQQWRLQ